MQVGARQALVLRCFTHLSDHCAATVNAWLYLRTMFAVSDLDNTLGILNPRGAARVWEVVQYLDAFCRCCIREPEGLLIGLVELVNR